MKKVSIITVNYNQPEVTEALLLSIEKYNTYTNIEVIVVDNGSRINKIPIWQKQYPQYQFIRSEKNLGFAGGNNLGINIATGDYFFLINNDTEITPLLIDTLVATLDANSSIGVISPLIKYYDDKNIIQYAGFTEMNYFTARNNCVGKLEQDKGQYNGIIAPTGFAHGAAMMITKAAIDKAGLMAEHFFLYYEEIDWCARIKKAGFEIWINTNALIYHKESVSVGKQSALKEYFMNRNRILFMRRNASLFQLSIFYLFFFIIIVPKNILQYIVSRKPSFILQMFKAIKWNFTNNVNSHHLGIQLTQ